MIQTNLQGSALRAALATCCGIAFLLFGYNQGLFGAVIGLETFQRDFAYPGPSLVGVMASVYSLGCLFGAIAAFLTADSLGRKGSVGFGSWVVLIGTILQTSTTGKIQMIVSRLISGVGIGLITVNVPIWQAESFKSHNRGALLVVQSAFIALGYPLSTFMGLAGRKAEPSSFAWRWPIAFQGLFIIGILLFLPFLPESPRWLMQHERIEEATEVYARFQGSNATISDPRVLKEREEVMASIEKERHMGQASWTEIFTENKERSISRVLLGAGPYLFNQWSGINSLANYLPIIFEHNVGLSSEMSLIITGVLGVQYFLVSWLPYFFIEKAGRRNVLMSSAGACSFCMVMIAVMLRMGTVATLWLFVAFTFLFFDFFSLGILPISWMYASEIMPQRTRNKGVAMGVGLHWLSNFIIVFITPTAIVGLGYRLYIIWAVLNAIFVPITWFFYPETAGRSLEDVDDIFKCEKFGVTKTHNRGSRCQEGTREPADETGISN